MLDLETYIRKYRGETRLQRLLHIGKTSEDDQLVTQAYELAEAQMKEDGNVVRYREVFGDGTWFFVCMCVCVCVREREREVRAGKCPTRPCRSSK